MANSRSVLKGISMTLNKRSESPIKTMARASHTKDFKVMHELSNQVEILQTEELLAKNVGPQSQKAKHMLHLMRQTQKLHNSKAAQESKMAKSS